MLDEKIRFLMSSQGITIESLSDKSGVPMETIRNIIYKKALNPRLNTIHSLADALCVSMDFLASKDASSAEDRLMYYYRQCSRHGRLALDTIARAEASICKNERVSDHHIIQCLVPTMPFEDGMIYDSCRPVPIPAAPPEAFLAIEITTNAYAPIYCRGDRMLLKNTFPLDGENALFLHHGRTYFRHFLIEHDCYILGAINGRGKDIHCSRMDQYVLIGTCLGVART